MGDPRLTRKEQDAQTQQNQGPKEAHVEGDAQLATRIFMPRLLNHAMGGHGLRMAGITTSPSSQALHIHIGVVLAAGALVLRPEPIWELEVSEVPWAKDTKAMGTGPPHPLSAGGAGDTLSSLPEMQR